MAKEEADYTEIETNEKRCLNCKEVMKQGYLNDWCWSIKRFCGYRCCNEYRKRNKVKKNG